MIKKLLVWTGHLILYVVVFYGLVWYLLAINPKEAWQMSVDNVQKSLMKSGSFMESMITTGKSMNQTANNHLNKASDRINGIDPYEADAKKFNDQVKDYVGGK